MACTRQIAWLSLLGALVPSISAAQSTAPAADPAEPSGRRTVAALRLAEGESIVLDGRLDEPVWSRAEAARDFIQRDPDNGKPATESTEVRVLYTHDALFIGVTCHDSEPDKVLAFQRRRDEWIDLDDRFQWTIDTFLDGRTGYFFEMNPAGQMGDALLSAGYQSREWDGVWDGRVDRNGDGWTIEVELPFRTLNFREGQEAWGINFQRTVRRKNEDTLWSGWLRNQGLMRMANAGLLTGLRDISQGRGLEFKPYGLARAVSSPGDPQVRAENQLHAGLDVSYSVTPSLRAILTTKTDFAQTEVDLRQLNLTRYSLFFPERRSFFLDGSPYFELRTIGPAPNGWGDGNAPMLNPFFSRRIGLNADDAPQSINFGAKLIGQAGAQDIGLLHVQTENDAGMPGDNFTVARVRRRMLRESHVGVFYTRRASRAAADPVTSQTAGADVRLATSHFRGSSNLEMRAYFLKTPRAGETGRDAAFGGELSYPNDRWSWRAAFREVQERFDPSVGFITRNGYRLYTSGLFFSPRPARDPVIRRTQVGADLLWLQNARGSTTLLRTVTITLPGIDLHAGDSFQFQVVPTEETLDEDFTLGGMTLPAGSHYRYNRYRVQLWSANQRFIGLGPQVEWGGFYSGKRLRISSYANLKLRPGVFVYLTGEWNRVMLPQGEYRTRLGRIVLETQFSPRVAFVNNIQYDTQSAMLGWQSRFRWILDPGNDLYIVYTHNWLDDPVRGRFYTLNRSAASKIIYTRRF